MIASAAIEKKSVDYNIGRSRDTQFPKKIATVAVTQRSDFNRCWDRKSSALENLLFFIVIVERRFSASFIHHSMPLGCVFAVFSLQRSSFRENFVTAF